MNPGFVADVKDNILTIDITAPLYWWMDFLALKEISILNTKRICGIRYYCKTGISEDNFYWHDDYSRACLDQTIKDLNIALYRYKTTAREKERDELEAGFWDLVPQCFLDRKKIELSYPEVHLILAIAKGKVKSGPVWDEFISELERV